MSAPIAEDLLRGRIALRDRELARREHDRWCSAKRRATAERSWNLLTHAINVGLRELLPFADGRDLDRPPWFSEVTTVYWVRVNLPGLAPVYAKFVLGEGNWCLASPWGVARYRDSADEEHGRYYEDTLPLALARAEESELKRRGLLSEDG